MRTCPRPSMPQMHQLSLLPGPRDMASLPPDERRRAVALLAALLIEASRPAGQEPADDGQ
jgi:hypothetical protein